MLSSLLLVFHKFNHFLSTSAGELLRRFSELILLTFASYMVASEWFRTKSKHLKYLLIGFGSLTAQKLLMTVFLAQIVFGVIDVQAYADYINLTQNFLEISALIAISSAFLYAVHEKHHISLRKKSYIEFAIVAAVFTFSALIALGLIPFLPFGIKRKIIYASLELTKFFILLYPIFIFWKTKELTKYNRSVAAAFIIYSISPLLHFLNIAFYYGKHAYLLVLAHPFPFIAIVLFTRVLFLKLVDKATLREELLITKQKYIREKEISSLKDEFVSTVSHELRTPLTSTKLYLNLLLQGKAGLLNEKQQDIITTLNTESNRLTSLINDILDLSRLEQNKEKINLKKTELFKLIESCSYHHLAEEKQIAIVNNVARDFVVVLDHDKFKQVVINLVTNAIKHTSQNGTVTLTAQKKKKEMIFSVSDTGVGIPEDVIPYIFDKFYQAESHMTRKTGGLGLGLTIVKKIVDLHKGTIKVKSEVGKGTTFTILIPHLDKEMHKQRKTITDKTPTAEER